MVALRVFFIFFTVFPSWSAHSAGIVMGLFPAAGGFCQPLPHCPGFLCSPAPTIAFSASLYICALFALVCSVCFVLLSAVFFFPPVVEPGNKTHTQSCVVFCSSLGRFGRLSINLSNPSPHLPSYSETHAVRLHVLLWLDSSRLGFLFSCFYFIQ